MVYKFVDRAIFFFGENGISRRLKKNLILRPTPKSFIPVAGYFHLPASD
jgi:hypothetical protein